MGINTDAVQRLYVAYFNRPADPIGLAYWEGQLSSTVAATQAELEAIASGFSGSAEYAALYAGQSNAQIIDNLYLNLFARNAEPAGLIYWAGQLTSGAQTFAQIALQLTYSAQGTDADAIANKLTAATSFTTELDTTAEIIGYSGTAAATSARTWLATVTDVATTLTTATAGVATAVTAAVAEGSAVTVTGQTFTLTTSADDLTGTSGNDTFVAAGGRLSTDDRIDGGAGTDTFCAVLTTSAAPVILAIEQINIDFRNATAGLDLADASGYTAIQVAGNTNGQLNNIGDAAKVTLNAYDDSVTINLDAGANTTANSITITVAGDSSGGFNLSSGIETVNLAINQSGFTTNSGAGLFDLEDAKTLNVSGTGNFTLAASAGFNSAMTNLSIISASALNGIATLNFGTGAADVGAGTALNVVGGAGNDVFAFSAAYQSTDTVDGGAGTDSLSFIVGSTSTIRPNLTNTETLNVTFAAAGTLDGRSAAGITTLNTVFSAADGNFTRLQAVTAINAQKADGATDDLSVTYQTGSDLDITVNLGIATANFVAGDLTVAGNNGAATLSVQASATVALASATFADATAFNMSADQTFTLDALTLASAASVQIDLSKSLDMGSAILNGVTTALTINAAGTAAAFSAGQISGDKLQSLTFNANAIGNSQVEVTQIDLQASALQTITVSSNSTADINFANIDVVGAGAGANFDVVASVGSGAVFSADFTLFSFAPTAAAVDITFTLGGEGSYNIGLLAASANNGFDGTVVVNAGGMSSGNMLSAQFTAFTVASGTIEATLGAGSDYFEAGAGDDTLTGGDGADTLIGGGGADSIMGGAGGDRLIGGAGDDYVAAGAGANTIVLGGAGLNGIDTIELLASTASTASDTIYVSTGLGFDQTATLGMDTIQNARSGDTFFFSITVGSGAATAVAALLAAQSGRGNFTGYHTGAVQCATLAQGTTAVGGMMAIYSNGADTILEVNINAGAGFGTAGNIQVFTLEGFALNTAAMSAQFMIDSNATALSITLL